MGILFTSMVPFIVSGMSIGWPSSHNRRMEHWFTRLYKAVLYDIPAYLFSRLTPRIVSSHNLHSCEQISCEVPQTLSSFAERGFKVFAPTSWAEIQDNVRLDRCIILNNFKTRIKDHLTNIVACFINHTLIWNWKEPFFLLVILSCLCNLCCLLRHSLVQEMVE